MEVQIVGWGCLAAIVGAIGFLWTDGRAKWGSAAGGAIGTVAATAAVVTHVVQRLAASF